MRTSRQTTASSSSMRNSSFTSRARSAEPANRTLIYQAITASMPQLSILDLLTETEQWLDLHKLLARCPGLTRRLTIRASVSSRRCSATAATSVRARRRAR
ncbi:protein of unknown function (plasmid) [Paraburkholderia dioscoreae]|uniref:Uncharacterized protein n=1 Tax=Paraburkholderia dioscoreae TaxID=2604047 RepID=A0A5Q4ZL88_9BURK|nr:protein of unknown function [Paraburkholderia dioscoreae]